jgi:predicted CoA-substrate-specific enzyme activase
LGVIIDFATATTRTVYVGVDVGSTTTKVVVLDARTHDVLYSVYRRHHANQAESLKPIFAELADIFPHTEMHLVMSGSGGKGIADTLDVPYVQEVVANATAVQRLYGDARCAIELGGQDAKMIFFDRDEATGRLSVSDMRMNGSCAGGTGAFIDEVASLLKTPVEELDGLAASGTTVYDISGRCGVYAKTDIQPLLNQGVAKADLALSTFHAIAKQTLGGLAQGLDIKPPVIFEGGPLTFNPTLIDVFAERLDLKDGEVIIPDHPETIVAMGAALAAETMFSEEATAVDIAGLAGRLDDVRTSLQGAAQKGTPFFADAAERAAFEERHALPESPRGVEAFEPGQTVRAWLGIDSGSTTTKFVLMDDDDRLIDAFYASNKGEPLDIAQQALSEMGRRYREAGVNLEILGCGTTGYGENLFAHAYHADAHMVETVAHAFAAAHYEPDVSFVLDIGGQDMKAIWIDDGIVTDILVNEACSSGCGSFLQSFATSLGIDVRDIADQAFASTNPAVLGSRCTVFMNSSVVTEQKNGKTSADIMAGLCRSIIENVFTKVIRVSNVDSLGGHVVVQGGTFLNDAVLAAFEDYIGKPVVRAPYPGLMGAIGAALLTKKQVGEAVERDGAYTSTFIGLDAVGGLTYEQTPNVTCPFCTNRCARTLVRFSDGSTYVTGNRCERGAVVGDPKDAAVRERVRQAKVHKDAVPNLFAERQRLLFQDWPVEPVCEDQGLTIGLPRVLALWDNAPFWTTLLRALGFGVRLSNVSTRAMYEEGLSAVASDTVCFPAKLVHGHVRDLVHAGVDRILMPTVTTVPSENTEATSESMCAVVKGYAMVIRNTDNPEERFGVPFDNPLFHWYTDEDRARQLTAYFSETYGIGRKQTERAIEQADAAQRAFAEAMCDRGREVLDGLDGTGGYAVVLASRPYHNDPLVNHDLPEMLTEMGIPVLTPDAIPGVTAVDLSASRLDIVNNFHARMLSSALIAAQDDRLEYVQLVSFGCGHDAYLSDEIIRLMKAAGGKTPLVLKVDESDASGPLHIRVRSFVETVNMRRAAEQRKAQDQALDVAPQRPKVVDGVVESDLPDPYPQKFTKADRESRVILVPNTSHAFSRLMAAVFSRQGVRAVAMPVGGDEAIRLGKKYVHNDICFPAQITIGEALAELESGKYDDCQVAIGTGKYIGDCRLTHYAALLRKALDDAGYADVPIITNDDVDYHDMQPGWKMNMASAVRIAMGLPMIDVLEELLRKIRPYELVKGAADTAFESALDAVVDGMRRHGVSGAKRGFKRAITIMNGVAYDRSHPRPRVLIVGEYLLNFHPGANHEIERYLEDNGFEVVEARMTDVIRKTYFYKDAQVKEYHVNFPKSEATWYAVANAVFEHAHDVTDRIAAASPLYKPAARMPQIVQASDPIIHHTFDAGEGVLIPAEIIHNAEEGCEAFVILQPFGCLPNHIVGRGIAKRLKEMYPNAQILPLDYDPDVSFANLENRLQMLIMNTRKAADERAVAAAADERAAEVAEVTAVDGAARPAAVEAVGEDDRDDRENHNDHNDHGGPTAGASGDDTEVLSDVVDLSEEIAACAGQVAAIAQDLESLAAQARSRTHAAPSTVLDLQRAIATGDEVLEHTRALAMRADDQAVRIDALMGRLSDWKGKDASVHVGGMEAVAARARDLAHLASSETQRCIGDVERHLVRASTLRDTLAERTDGAFENLSSRADRAFDVASMRVDDAMEGVAGEARRYAEHMSVQAGELRSHAETLVDQATALIPGTSAPEIAR